jgi:hypothetical protein
LEEWDDRIRRRFSRWRKMKIIDNTDSHIYKRVMDDNGSSEPSVRRTRNSPITAADTRVSMILGIQDNGVPVLEQLLVLIQGAGSEAHKSQGRDRIGHLDAGVGHHWTAQIRCPSHFCGTTLGIYGTHIKPDGYKHQVRQCTVVKKYWRVWREYKKGSLEYCSRTRATK